MKTIAVIGKNYGDEGKGLVTASLSSLYKNPLIIKHNGGAQAGHTVENNGIRFIHHQIASGAEFKASTLFAISYHPDLFQLGKEIDEFKSVYGFIPRIFTENSFITTIDDVLLNMALESHRDNNRHGSCGMGINECNLRIKAGYSISILDIMNNSKDVLEKKLLDIRNKYTIPRMNDIGIIESNQYYNLLMDDNVIRNFVLEVYKNVKYLELVDADIRFLNNFDALIFETGQGLLLDEDYIRNAPHLTSSKTGIKEAQTFLEKRCLKLDEAFYVTRSYVTRHGEGPLPNQINKKEIPHLENDLTNIPNLWQGVIRYARHENLNEFINPINDDLNNIKIKKNLVITHLNETDGYLFFKDRNIQIDEFISLLNGYFDSIYLSSNHTDIKKIK